MTRLISDGRGTALFFFLDEAGAVVFCVDLGTSVLRCLRFFDGMKLAPSESVSIGCGVRERGVVEPSRLGAGDGDGDCGIESGSMEVSRDSGACGISSLGTAGAFNKRLV